MQIRFLILAIFGFVTINSYSQTDENIRKPDYLTFQTGFIIDGYNSLGIRTFFEYQKDCKGNWQYGISYEHSRHFGFFATDQLYDLSTNLSLLSFNCYYKLNIIKDRFFWTSGLGIGAIHAYWEDNNKFGVTINACLTLNIRITKKIYLETSPLIVLLPINRVYFSTMNADHFDNFYALTFFPFGIKVKL